MVYNKDDNRKFPHDPALSGYKISYRQDQVNHCPACARSHWHVGRVSAECAFCLTVLPLDTPESYGSSRVIRNGHRLNGNARPAWAA